MYSRAVSSNRSRARLSKTIRHALVTVSAILAACSEPPTRSAMPHVTGGIAVEDISIEHRHEPLGIDLSAPRFGWILNADYNGARQTAYELRVSSSPANNGDIWASGHVSSADSYNVEYVGPALASGTRYFVAVRVWDGEAVSPWSAPAAFETAFIDPNDFTGDWIARRTRRADTETPETLLRTTFKLPDKQISQARAYVAGLGYHRVFVNGERVGDQELAPAYTPYNRRVLYLTYDISDALKVGDNAIGVSLGRGFFADYNNVDTEVAPWLSEPKLKLRLDVRFKDGTEQQVLSNDGWLSSDGPTLSNSTKYGETYDARREQPGWTTPGFDDSGWQPVEFAEAPTGVLAAQSMEPIKIVGELPDPVSSQIDDATTLYDFRTTRAGWARLRLKGPTGSSVTIRYGEKLTPEGRVNSGNDGPFGGIPVQVYRYTLKGDPNGEIYEPRYSYNGFRFVEVETASGVMVESIQGLELHNDVAKTGTFNSSSDLLNRYHRAMVQSTLSNLHGIPTDTPMYEKRGWAADAMLIVDSALMNLGSENVWEKWMTDHRDNQAADGGLAVIVPNQNPGGPQGDPFVGLTGDPIWSSSYVLVNHALYRHRGNLRTVRDNYPGMRAWMHKWMSSLQTSEYVFDGTTWGDHEPAYGSGMGNRLVGTAYVYRSAMALAEMARAIGQSKDADTYVAFAGRVRDALNANYYDGQKRNYDFPYAPPVMGPPPGVELPEGGPPEGFPFALSLPPEEINALQFQTDNVLPLALSLEPPRDRNALCAQLLEDVAVTNDGHITTGATVLKDVLPVLTECGGAETAFRSAVNPTFPGWGYWFETLNGSKAVGGETIIVDTHWEAWHEHARSHNHAFRGTIDDWLYQYVAGIRLTTPGYRSVRIKPYPVGDLTFANASIETPLGRVASAWSRTEAQFSLEVEVPVGASAEVHVPRSPGQRVIASADAVRLLETGDYAIYQVGSGAYQFRVAAE